MTTGVGRLIVLEGAEGVGKTTQLGRLAERLERSGVAHVAVREPGGTPVGDEIRRLLLHGGHELTAAAEALLFMASRAELVERIVRPALADGRVVLADRFFLSTYAYQVAGRQLDEASVRGANRFATGGVSPDLTILLQLPLQLGLARAGARGSDGPDRIEATGTDFHRRVDTAFAAFVDPAWQLSHPECGRIVAVDATGTRDDVAERLWRALGDVWPETFPHHAESHQLI